MEDKMKGLILAVASLLAVPALALAQDAGRQYRGEGYVFIGEGLDLENFSHGVSHVGGGGEVLLLKGLGVESELGAMGTPGAGVGLFSIDPTCRLLPSSSKSKVVPFVDAGYTRAFGNDGYTRSDNLFNLGVGIHYWPFKRVGLRLDLRDYLDHGGLAISHIPAIRIALAVR
jgi:hypothetical protein